MFLRVVRKPEKLHGINIASCRISDGNEPNGLEFENCAVLQLDKTKPLNQKSWRDIPCVLNSEYYYICEYKGTKERGTWMNCYRRKIIKVRSTFPVVGMRKLAMELWDFFAMLLRC